MIIKQGLSFLPFIYIYIYIVSYSSRCFRFVLMTPCLTPDILFDEGFLDRIAVAVFFFSVLLPVKIDLVEYPARDRKFG